MRDQRAHDVDAVIWIACMLTSIILAIIAAVTWGTLPDWCEALFSAIGGGAVVKLADCISALVQLSSGRTIERQGTQLAQAGPIAPPVPETAAAAAEQVARAAENEADAIGGGSQLPYPPPPQRGD